MRTSKLQHPVGTIMVPTMPADGAAVGYHCRPAVALLAASPIFSCNRWSTDEFLDICRR
jgi:hypothetical protein